MKRESTVRKRIERTQVVRKIDKKRVRDLQRFGSSSKNQRNEESERERERTPSERASEQGNQPASEQG